jgi:hypothetical protein
MNRHSRRAAAKVGGKSPSVLANIADVTSKLQGLVGAGEQVQGLVTELEGVLAQVNTARDALLEESEEIRYELERQRWVTLRLVGTFNPVDPSDVEALLALEEQYRGEYDAIQALAQLQKKS